MNDSTPDRTPEPSNPAPSATGTTPPRRRGRWLLPVAVFLTGTLVGGTAVTGAAAWALGFGGHGWRHGGEFKAEHAQERMRDRMAWVLGRVDATDEQETRIGAITDAAITELAPLVSAHRGKRAELAAALSGESVDAEAVERLRAAALSDMESGSRILTDALVQSAEVLTPEQRQTLMEAVRRHRH